MALANNDLGDEGAAKISEALLTNTSLTWMSMSSNQLTDKGLLFFEPVVKEKETLKSILLFDNLQVTVEACDKLWAANEARTTPMTDNLYGMVLNFHSPPRRKREEEKEAEKKTKKKPGGPGGGK